ncbi:helix-turn-helix domain-containing protein [Actinokineospora globicatena]|uniref:HTH cro/C1-type domain-containing protein n=1 Tax=Actinokineospora globicatena TaxID=103729 RepID=A0A9W6QJX3_9PSEU|nr:helix-turn-helix transcriptional regulator [Actinokineospora globicatena]GLW90882.1 hypothetical protein Aglo03_16980 [Actinokineospora globicatena]
MGGRGQAGTVRVILEAAGLAGWPLAETVRQIRRQCGVTPLRAHRLANGWTLAEVAARVRAQVSATGQQAPHVNHPNVSRWETGAEQPSARNLDALCQIYRARPDILGFGADYTDQADHTDEHHGGTRPAAEQAGPSGDREDRMRRRDVLRGLLSTAGVGFGGAALDAIEGTRRAVTEALQRRSVEAGTVGWWEEQAESHADAYRRLSAPRLLAEVTLDFDDLQQVLAQRQSLDSQLRLTTVTARMAGLVGILCVDLGAIREARRWFHTGQIAAEEINDRSLQAWLFTREALASLYYGSATDAATLARTARRLAGGTASTASAMAPAVEARALAGMGRGTEALAAIRHAESVFENLPRSVTTAGVYGFTEPKLRFYQGNVFARAADPNRALAVHDQALRLYPAHDRVDRGHIQLDQALSLVRHGEFDEACHRIGQVFLGFTGDEGIGPVAAQAREIRWAIPERLRRHAAVRHLDEVLALPPGAD